MIQKSSRRAILVWCLGIGYHWGDSTVAQRKSGDSWGDTLRKNHGGDSWEIPGPAMKVLNKNMGKYPLVN